MQMRQSIGQRLELSQDLRLEQRLELKLKLKQELRQELKLTQKQINALLEDFYIKLEFDNKEDKSVLEKSMMYLILHELNHPVLDLYQNDFLKLIPCCQVPDFYCAKEVLVDALATESGTRVCGASLSEVVESHYAIAERVYKNEFVRKSRKTGSYNFLARITAELEAHFDETKNVEISELAEKFNESAVKKYGEDFIKAKESYRKLYDGARKVAERILERS